ncbi:Fpg/Nei family DNA glycosylase [Streptomyces sp. NPDC059740]|uniref:Fpg/Nei family DNA glycosylase n=1 Tax=Streptomyces sp. NPDC059740 TaxID=3346926 RepID=UPI00365200E5
MPELPDVEAFREVLADCAQGRLVRRVDVRDSGVLNGVDAPRLRRELAGRRLAAPYRHGKWLFAPTDGPTVLFHFGMTGSLLCPEPGEPLARHDRVVLTFADEVELRYRDQRKLKGLWLADPATADRTVAEEGPDALTVGRKGFEAALTGRRARIKAVLTDQSALAGLGNLLADEILWRARLHPARATDHLSREDRDRLHRAMRRTLREAVRAGRVPPRPSWLTGHRDGEGETCPRCGTELSRGRVAGRGTVWCPHCQPADD